MDLTTILANRFREVILTGQWIANTNWKNQLADLTWQQATTKVGSLNTIAALTFHVHYYIAGVVTVLEGGPLEIRDKYSFDVPLIDSEESWQGLKNALWTDAERFAQLVEQLADEKLEAAFVDEKYGNYLKNIEGMIEHCYYHLGQVVLIKKMLIGYKTDDNRSSE